ncbi:MAG: hypothetical protein C5B51_22445 [Terriglobia bacterium]|nr:MAG: hypothetical protein C5B51_22445 [Terriglobia bacterium]
MATILVVDDDYQIRKLLRALLIRAGHQVQTARHAQAALDLCRPPAHFDVVLSGVALAGMDGHDLARWMAANCPRTQVALISATDSLCESCPYLQRCRIIPKPFKPQEVVSAVTELLARPPETRGSLPQA